MGGEDDEDAKEQAYLARLDSGLYTLQLTDIVIATCAVRGARSVESRIWMLLEQRDIPRSRLADTIKEYKENLGTSDEARAAEDKEFVDVLLEKLSTAGEEGS